jgi:hypothetical protein
MGLLGYLKALFKTPVLPTGSRRLDGRSKALLAASLRFLRDDEPGWITMQEAKTLYSPVSDAYAFGEIDEIGKANLAAFAVDHGGPQFEFMPVEGRLYFMRKPSRRRVAPPIDFHMPLTKALAPDFVPPCIPTRA